MGKVKSAIITGLVLAAILVLSLFATISCDVPGTNHVSRYNSFLSSIHLGGDLTGEAYTLLYPEGVISVSDYNLVVEDEGSEDREEYIAKYVQREGVYVEKELVETKEAESEFLSSIAKDAGIIAKRFGEKGYSKYSVSIEDECSFVIRVSVPTNFTYAAYREYDSTERSNALTEISNSVTYLTLSGTMSLRDNSEYDSSNSLLAVNDDFATYFKSVSHYQMGGTHAVRMELTDEGFDKLNKIMTSSEEGTAYIFAGETSIGLTIEYGTELESKTLYFTPGASTASDFSIVLASMVGGDLLTNSYNDDPAGSGTMIIAASASFGEYAAIYLLVALLLVLAAVIAGSIIKYKKLGLVNSIMALIYALAIVISLMLIKIQLTVAGAFIIALGLALLTFTNFRVFEAVRKETLIGRTISASVKAGYKNTIATILDLHIVLLVVSAMVTLICAGELAACGLILFIATIASYALYWFTRFMWYVISSMAKDKFKFCGYTREAFEDED